MTRPAEKVFRVVVQLLVGCMALAAIVIADGPFGHYSELARGTLTYYTVSLAAGLALFLCVLLSLVFPRQLHRIIAGGLLPAIALGINQVLGLHLGAILCFTPS